MRHLYYCPKCGKQDYNHFKFCSECGTKSQYVDLKEFYSDPYGLWEVTTEGDCEGKSVKHLGTYKGFVDEIAFMLQKNAYYKLLFKKLIETQFDYSEVKEKQEVMIAFDIDSATWDMKQEERKEYFQTILAKRPVNIEEGNYYASVKLIKKG